MHKSGAACLHCTNFHTSIIPGNLIKQKYFNSAVVPIRLQLFHLY